MPFEIVRNDIVLMHVDCVVNSTSMDGGIGAGVDFQIHKAAGSQLLKARENIGRMKVSDANITKGYDLNAKYVIHTVCPLYESQKEERQLLYQCYENCLNLAMTYQCHSIAFPLLSSGSLGFPKEVAMEIAMEAISHFLLEHEMMVFLVVFDTDSLLVSQKLFHSITSYLEENYVEDTLTEEYETELVKYEKDVRKSRLSVGNRVRFSHQRAESKEVLSDESVYAYPSNGLEEKLENLDLGFSEYLLHLIDLTGKKDSEIYKKANISRKLFSKIRINPDYHPTKQTVIAFAFALQLNLHDTKDLLKRAGYALSHSYKFDVIVEYFILNQDYNIYRLNEVLFSFDLPLIGSENIT